MKKALLAFGLVFACFVLLASATALDAEEVEGKSKSRCGKGLVKSCLIFAKEHCGTRKCCAKIRFGVDTNDPSSPTHIKELRAGGVTFVVRYISQSATPPLATAEAKLWAKAKMDMVAVFETSRTRAIEGGSSKKNFANGRQDAKVAAYYLQRAGGHGKPIYFTVDAFVAPSKKLWKKLKPGLKIKSVAAIVPYFKGISSVIKKNRLGAYGSYTTIKGLFDRNIIKYGWEASSFDSSGRLDPRAQLYQCSTLPPDHFGIGQLDYDFALSKDFGQWRPKFK